MARPPAVPGKRVSERLTIRLDPDMLDWIDTRRGTDPRGTYIRALIAADMTPRTTIGIQPVTAGVPSTAQTVPTLTPPVAQANPPSLPTGGYTHRHKRGLLLTTAYTKGSATRTYLCAVDGCDTELH